MTRNQPTHIDAPKLEEQLVHLLEGRDHWTRARLALRTLRDLAALEDDLRVRFADDPTSPFGQMHRARIPRITAAATIRTEAIHSLLPFEKDALEVLAREIEEGRYDLRLGPDLVDDPDLSPYDDGISTDLPEWPFDTDWTKTGLALGALLVVPAAVALKALDIARNRTNRKAR